MPERKMNRYSKKGNNSRIAQERHNTFVIGEQGQIEEIQFHRMQNARKESVGEWPRYMRDGRFKAD
jgi:hypothetical protein